MKILSIETKCIQWYTHTHVLTHTHSRMLTQKIGQSAHVRLHTHARLHTHVHMHTHTHTHKSIFSWAYSVVSFSGQILLTIPPWCSWEFSSVALAVSPDWSLAMASIDEFFVFCTYISDSSAVIFLSFVLLSLSLFLSLVVRELM